MTTEQLIGFLRASLSVRVETETGDYGTKYVRVSLYVTDPNGKHILISEDRDSLGVNS
jgi:hypothetical protein